MGPGPCHVVRDQAGVDAEGVAMERSRVWWSVGLALSLSGCAGTSLQRVAGAPSPLASRGNG